MRAIVATTALSALLMAGCSTAGTIDREPSVAVSAASADGLLAAHGLAGGSTTQIVDRLDRLSLDARPASLKASVRPHEVLLSSGAQEYRLPVPQDRFYLSVAPYVNHTHDCFFHSLTTCKGELAGAGLRVKIVDEANDKVLVDEVRTTFANGFVGFWLPRNIEGVLRVSHAGKSGEARFATTQDAPTCLTTLKLA